MPNIFNNKEKSDKGLHLDDEDSDMKIADFESKNIKKQKKLEKENLKEEKKKEREERRRINKEKRDRKRLIRRGEYKEKPHKKWKEMDNKEKVLFILWLIKKIFGKIVRFFAKTFLVLLVLGFIAGCYAAYYLGVKFWPVLMDYKEQAYAKFDEIGPNTFTYLGNTVIYDSDGNVISEINIGNYIYITADEIPPLIQKGYIAVEDKRFRVHNGIDFKAITRAAVDIVRHHGQITQGGSTITQQVIKNGLLTQERTFTRKLLEFFLAPEFEKQYSKQQVMEFYVNTNFYGNNCYGIETASRYYFDKPSNELSIAEVAVLVGISNNGSYYNPKTNMEGVMKRQKIVLGEMLEEHFITEDEYNQALKEELNWIYHREPRKKESYQTSYAIRSATLKLMKEQGFEFQYLFETEEEYNAYYEKYNTLFNAVSEDIRAGGYRIYTSLDTEMQNKAQEILDNSLSRYKEVQEDGRFAFQGAVVVVNNETGFVEAIIGGRGTEDEFNRGYLARRQPGSSIKPLVVYTPAFNSGTYYPSLIMTDKDDPEDEYYPKNVDGSHRGNMPVREAVARSINTIAYQVMKDISPRVGLEYLAKMRFDTLAFNEDLNTAVALGGFTYGVRVVDMAKGYSTLVNHGEYIDNSCIYKIEYQNQGVIFEEESERLPVFEADAAYMMVNVCQGVMENGYGTGYSRRVKGQTTMGKTGTTNDTKDVWFCGASPYYSVAVWLGYDTPKSTNLTGGSIPGQIWNSVMTEIHKGLEKKDFERPETVVDLDVDYQGKISEYPTGKTDIFSQTLLDKADAERLAFEERKKIEADRILIDSLLTQLEDLRNYAIKDVDAVSYLRNRYRRISNSIADIYQEDKRVELENELLSIQTFFASDIRAIEKYEERQKILSARRSEIGFENTVIMAINEFNAYVVTGRESVEYVDETFVELMNSINLLSNKEKITEYQSKLGQIKMYKELLLEPYRAEIQQELEIKQGEMRVIIESKLSELESVRVYYEGVTNLFSEIELLLEEAEELQMEMDLIEYQERYDSARSYIDSLKPSENRNPFNFFPNWYPNNSQSSSNNNFERDNFENDNSDMDLINPDDSIQNNSEISMGLFE